MKNRVEVLLTAKDQITGSLGSIVGGFAAALAGLAVAGIALAKLKDGIGDAAKVQTSLIVSAGDVGTLMGVSYGKALSSVKEIQKEISSMAANLPGETAGYSAIANAITATMALGAKGNLKQFKEDTVEITRTLGLLAATKDADMGNAGQAANKFISGSYGFSEAKHNDIFERNPVFLLYLKDALKSIGKQEGDWQKLSQEVRNKTFKLAGRKAYSDEMLSNLDGTAESLIQGIKTKLFDSQVGVFGFLRELGGLNGKTALDSVSGTMQALMFASSSAGNFLAKYGVSFDPMELVARGFDFATEALNGINQVLSGNGMSTLKSMFESLNPKSLKSLDPNVVAANITKLSAKVLNWFQNIDTTQIAEGINGLLSTISDWVKHIDGARVGQFLADMISTAMGKTVELAGKIDWKKLCSIIEDAIGKLFSGIASTIGNLGIKGWEQFKTNTAANTQSIGRYLGSDVLPSSNQIKRFTENPGQSTMDTFKDFFGIGGDKTKVDRSIKSYTDDSNYDKRSALPSISNQSNNLSASASSFSPVIHVTGVATNLQETADYVLSALNAKYIDYRAGVLT